MHDLTIRVEAIKNRIKQIVQDGEVIVAFSGGLDSTVVLHLALSVLGSRRVTAVNIDFGPYTYQRARENVNKTIASLKTKLVTISGESDQVSVLNGGPDCNLCTRQIKLGLIKKYSHGQIILTGSNQSDSWGQFGSDFQDGMYAPLFECSKEDIKNIADDLYIEIRRIGENAYREGCKLKHLLKPLINPFYHGQAVQLANEVLLAQLEQTGMTVQIANVKIIGPLQQNIALINVFPLPDNRWLTRMREEIMQLPEIEECEVVDQPLELVIKANKGQFNNLRSRYWLEKGRLQPEFAFPVRVRWLLTTNRKLKTFQVVDYNRIEKV